MKVIGKKKLLFVLQTAVFAVGFLFLFEAIGKVFLYKDLNYYNYSNFKNQPEHSIDILVMGSSHSIDAVDAAVLGGRLEREGVSADVFNMSITGMRMEQIAYRFQEALKTQTPGLLIVETFSLTPMEERDSETVRRYAIDYLPLSFEKLQFIHDHIGENRSSFYVPFIKYHTRWSELTSDDFRSLSSHWVEAVSAPCGKFADKKPDYAGEWDAWFEQDFTAIRQAAQMDARTKKAVERLLSLAAEKEVKVLFLSVPYKVQMDFPNTELIKYNNYLNEHYVNDETVFLLDLNRQIRELEWDYRYMQDEGHVNDRGREAVMDRLSRYILDHLSDSLGEDKSGI